jgi:hypothetical protein
MRIGQSVAVTRANTCPLIGKVDAKGEHSINRFRKHCRSVRLGEHHVYAHGRRQIPARSVRGKPAKVRHRLIATEHNNVTRSTKS